MKRIFFVWIFALLIFSAGVAKATGSSHIVCTHKSKCRCFIQRGDEGNFVKGIIKLLKEQGYLPKNEKTGEYTKAVEKAVQHFQKDHSLAATGTMDDDTLTWLIWGMSPEQLDTVMPLIPGKPETYPDTVYVPTDGGKKRHSKAECSKMEDPRKVSIRNAAMIGFDACKKCEYRKELTLH